MSRAKKYYPFVSVCTPTFNRRPFIENIIKCYKNQTYPKNRMEWIIIDDGTDPIQDILAKENIPIMYSSVFSNPNISIEASKVSVSELPTHLLKPFF